MSYEWTEEKLAFQLTEGAVIGTCRVWFWHRARMERAGWRHRSGRVRPLMELPMELPGKYYIGGINVDAPSFWKTRTFG